jgi:hypothetical protein
MVLSRLALNGVRRLVDRLSERPGWTRTYRTPMGSKREQLAARACRVAITRRSTWILGISLLDRGFDRFRELLRENVTVARECPPSAFAPICEVHGAHDSTSIGWIHEPSISLERAALNPTK